MGAKNWTTRVEEGALFSPEAVFLDVVMGDMTPKRESKT